MSPAKKKAEQASSDRKNLYAPVNKIILKVIKQLEGLELDVPIHKIAWMEVRGNFSDKRHKNFRADLIEFLKISNEYRRIYWNIIKLSRRKFEVEMIKDGSFAPDIREYESLKNEIPQVIIRGDKKLWIISFDDYLPRIRDRSLKKKKKPRDGARIFRAIERDLKEVKDTLIAQKKDSVDYANELKQGLRLMKREPGKPWGFWKDNSKDKPVKTKMKGQKDSNDTKPKREAKKEKSEKKISRSTKKT